MPTTRSCPLDPPPAFARIRAEAPVSRLLFPDGRTGWLVSDYAHLKKMLADPRFSSRPDRAANPFRALSRKVAQRPVRPGVFSAMDAPDHMRYRRLLTGRFTVRQVRRLAPVVEEIVTGRLDDMERRGGPLDLVRAFSLPVASMVICRFLGVPVDDHAQVQQRSQIIFNLALPGELKAATGDAMHRFMLRVVAHERSDPGAGLLGELARLSGADLLSDEELAGMGGLLLLAGHEPTAQMISLGVLALLRNPGQLELVRREPGLAGHAVDELLRFLSVVQFGAIRVAGTDVELGGRGIGAGDTVIGHMASANRDAMRFRDPDSLDVTRAHTPHLAFGHGAHQCLGQHLARLQLVVALRGLLARFPRLRLAVPAEQLRYRTEMVDYGVHELPVSW
ncbi:cytochrome P450 [Streptomyces albus subsp. chlorinus]|uniref:cytochrome P450 n=1 Tax=Streptomyces albus TaxID=1888 RepID=UPI001FACC963|nr:cytochrome P450 [Streptomyces albus]